MIYSITVTNPFITIIEIDEFLRPPISGNAIQQSAKFLDSKDRTQQSESQSQFIHTELLYSEPLQFKLVSSTINEMISFSSKKEVHPTKHRVYKASVNPIHTHSKKKNSFSKCKHNHIEVIIPVVIGEYEIDISMSNPVFFEHEIIGIKEVSNQVVLGDCSFIPIQFGKPLSNGTRMVSKAKIALKGDIIQKFTYSAKPNHDENASHQKQKHNHIIQKMDIRLIVLLSQMQKMKTFL